MLQTFSWRSPSQPLPELNLQLLQVPEQSLSFHRRARLPLLLHIRCWGRSFRLIANYLAASSFWSLARPYSQLLAEVEMLQSVEFLLEFQMTNIHPERVLGYWYGHLGNHHH